MILYEVDSGIDSLSGPQQNSWCTRLALIHGRPFLKRCPAVAKVRCLCQVSAHICHAFLLYTRYGKCPIYLVDLGNPFPLLLNPPPNTITPPHGFNIRGFLIIGSQKMDP